MTAAHERHPRAATNGACHGDASSFSQRGSGQPLAFTACAFDSTSPPAVVQAASER